MHASTVNELYVSDVLIVVLCYSRLHY